jgi:hypothetical protein
MKGLYKDLEAYNLYDPSGSKPVDDISKELGWSRRKSYSIKYFISELSKEELEVLCKASDGISFVIIDAICIQNKEHRLKLLQNIDLINNSDSPFTKIENLLGEWSGIDPLSTIRLDFWNEVGNYLSARHIDQYPFTKNAIGFIKSISFKGYGNLSRPQHDWLLGLIRKDKERGDGDRFFINEHLIDKGFTVECEIIKNYDK